MYFSHFLLLLLVSINNCFALFSKGEKNEKLKLQLIIAIIIFCLILLLLLLFLVTFLYCKLRTFEREHKMVLFTPIKKKKSSSNDFEKCSKRLGTGFKTSSTHCIKTTSVEKVSPDCILTHEHQECYEYQQCGSCQSACPGKKINPNSSSSITHICEEREALLNGRHLGTDLNDSS